MCVTSRLFIPKSVHRTERRGDLRVVFHTGLLRVLDVSKRLRRNRRSGEPLVILRDIYSNRYFTQLALGKTNAVVMANTTSAQLRRNRPDMVNELNLLDGVMVLAGGVPVQAAGSLVGAVGVSGAPGGDLDEACARAGAEAVREELEFAD